MSSIKLIAIVINIPVTCSTLADQSHGSLPFNSQALLTVWSGGFSHSSALSGLETTVCYLSNTFLWEMFRSRTEFWIKPLSEAFALGWEQRYASEATPDIRGGGGWAAQTRWHQPDVRGYNRGRLIEQAGDLGPLPAEVLRGLRFIS